MRWRMPPCWGGAMNDMTLRDMTGADPADGDLSVVVEENAVLARLFARLPLHAQASFTPDQIAALGLATYEPPTQHKIAIRRTFGFFGKGYYFALFMGHDRRGRRSGSFTAYADEFRADWRYLLGVFITLGLIGAVFTTAAVTVWYQAAASVGGAYRPVAVQEFLPFFN